MSIFYEENIGGDYDQDKNDFHNPNGERNYSDDNLYDEMNKLGDSYIKIKEYTSIFHDECINEYCGENKKPDTKIDNKPSNALSDKNNVKKKEEKPVKHESGLLGFDII